ncbi:MAG: 50S ribosomal protein L33 [Patescibacteria group bacterium]
MSQDHLIKLSCTTCKKVNYYSVKNRKSVERKIDLKKFCNTCRKRTAHKESKK